MVEEVRVRPLVTPSLLLGMGLGGVIDGIVVGWSGILLAVTWALAVVGVILLFRAGRRDDVVWSWRILFVRCRYLLSSPGGCGAASLPAPP